MRPLYILALASGLLLVALIAVVLARQGPEPASAAFPGANGKIAFVSNRDGDNEIFVMDADGTDQTQLTFNSGDDLDPAWSPDGTKIAFASRSGGIDVYTMNADGTNQAPITTHGNASAASWSPDGTKIAFVTFGPPRELHVMDADGSNDQVLTSGDLVSGPAWSPDGAKIAVELYDPAVHDDTEIYTINPDGTGGLTRVTYMNGGNGGAARSPAWSPDGLKLAFAGWTPGTAYEIFSINRDGTGLQGISNGFQCCVAWSPDGTRMAASFGDTIYVMNADGSNLVAITAPPESGYSPNWQPICSPCPTIPPPPTSTPCPIEVCPPTPTPTNTPTPTATSTPGPPPEMSLDVTFGDGPCPPSETADVCVPEGGAFRLSTRVVVAPEAGYNAFLAEIDYGSLSYSPATSAADEIVWPDRVSGLRFPTNPSGTEGLINFLAYSTAPGQYEPSSFFIGGVVEIELGCSGGANNLIELVPYAAGTNNDGTGLHVGTSQILPLSDSLAVSCIPPGTGDTDGDGCSDVQETSTMEGFGGRRNFLNRWDFFDTPNAVYPWDKTIDLFNDIFEVAARFGANDNGGAAMLNRTSDPMSTVAVAPAYHPGFDRSAPPQGADPWDTGAPDGEIDLFNDTFGVAMQFGHSCA